MTDAPRSASRRRLLRRLGVVATAGLAGCSGNDAREEATTRGASTPTESTSRQTTPTLERNPDARIGMVYATGGLDDDSFNDMANAGIRRASETFGIDFDNAEPSSSTEIEQFQREFAAATDPGYDLVCGIGFAQTDGIVANATEYADQQFLLVDGVATDDGEPLSNVANFVFREHQGSFQVGHLAGLLTGREFSAGAGETTDERRVGFVGGVEAPLVEKFEAGFRAGATHADEAVTVESAYAGGFSDPETGRELAAQMYSDGADIVYHAAGATGVGVFRAAQDHGRFAIGVDNDQSVSVPEYSDVILASMVKQVDTAVYRSITSLVEGKFEFRVGTVNALGLLEGGVRAVYGSEIGSAIPEAVTEQLDASRQAIVKNRIDVPSTVS
ncbi:BMP family lipoprotein [Halorussus marinus]|uniref:BMP family lipoprotein n=1 Tax=Halorussus marinus TaxID=2505976 RepID=UPI00106E6433|nr:BMP family protein [Halorussus marinus]